MDSIPANEYYISHAIAANQTTIKCNDMVVIDNLLKQGNELIIKKDFQQAMIVFNEGIKQIGDSYLSNNIEDDTGMKLILANVEEKKGNLERAVYLKRNVLESRIQVFNTLNQCNKITNQAETTKYIGEAWMEGNREVVMQLFTQENDDTLGQALFRYKPDHPQYNEIIEHLNGLNPGERKGVLPWPNAK